MDCFHLPHPATVHHVDHRQQVLAVDAGMIAVVDPQIVDDFLATNAAFVDGQATLGPTHFTCTGGGFICGTGGDGGFPFAAHIHDRAVHAVEVCLNDFDVDRDRWIPAGLIPAPSSQLLIGDPSFLSEYVPDPFDPPLDPCGVWTILALPRPGWAAVHIYKQHAKAEGANLVLRADWIPT